jgi:hypothetical protein
MSDRVSDAIGECENQSFVGPTQVVKESRLRKIPTDKYTHKQKKQKCWFNSGVPPLRLTGKTTSFQSEGSSSLKPFIPKKMLNK